jgi:DNA-binding beta-propeller fold protein YncE
MKTASGLLRSMAWAMLSVSCSAVIASAASLPHYLFTNNDNSNGNSSTVYTIDTKGTLTQKIVINTGGFGYDGEGSPNTNKLLVTHDRNGNCVYLSENITSVAIPVVTTISIATLKFVGHFLGSGNEHVGTNGLGLAGNESYIYADFSLSQTIGTYKKLSGCKLKFLGDVPAVGLNSGYVVGMKANQGVLVVTFSDGSIESFNIANGKPMANGDLQYSTAFSQKGDIATAVDITSDRHFAMFGDYRNALEVSDLSSGKLAPTVPYYGLGVADIGDIFLSPDEGLLYLTDFSVGRVSAARFDKTSGLLSPGCKSAVLKGYNHKWAFVAAIVLENTTGSGGVLYVTEPDRYIGSVRMFGPEPCSFSELQESPTYDEPASTLESAGVFLPRTF